MEREIVVTKKRKKEISLPVRRDYILQPNRITDATYEYSLYQEKLLNAVIFNLQEVIQVSFKNEDYKQLTIWKNLNSDSKINIKVALRDICKPQHYDNVKEALTKLAGIVVKIATENQTVKIGGLLTAEIPITPNYNSVIDIFIERHVAKWLIEIDKNEFGKPIHWTRFMYQITQSASNKYTAKIYKRLCSWREKGGFMISLDKFREWLVIENKYKDLYAIKTRILLPVQKDLIEKADLWFNCNSHDFVTKQGNVTYLNFKIITPDIKDKEAKLKDHVFHLLKTHFRFEARNIEQIRPIFDNAPPSIILEKINDLYQHYQQNSHKIKDITGYVTSSLLNEFCSPLLFN